MMTALRIHNFRSLREYKVECLTRVSLLVGANNAGKTSVLEAAELVLDGSVPGLIRSPIRRGEVRHKFDEDLDRQVEAEVNHLFHGHSLLIDSTFKIEAEAEGSRFFTCRVAKRAAGHSGQNHLIVAGDRLQPEQSVPFTNGGLVSDPPVSPFAFLQQVEAPSDSLESGWKIQFIDTAMARPSQLMALWDKVVLTPEETKVTQVLHIIEPTVERLAALSGTESGGIYVKLKGSDQRLPLGSMGEGIKRLLALSLKLVDSAGGYLLVDEIDTGLHHSVMVKMWRLVVEAAKRLDVQVLATTHSLDCVRALAALYEDNHEVRDLISLHRIERGTETSVPYSADEILAAAQHNMELR